MKLQNLPRFEKILFCLPLRGGVIALVYLNLLVAAVVFVVFGYLDFVKVLLRMMTGGTYDLMVGRARSKVHFNLVVPLAMVFALAELVMTVFALVALHLKKIKLIEAYLYYSTILSAFVFCFRMLDLYYVTIWIDLATTAVYLLFRAYYLISIRSLVKKPQDSSGGSIEMADENVLTD